MNVKVRIRKGTNEKSSLYLDIYLGTINNKPNRRTESLKGLWIYTNPKNKLEKEYNKENTCISRKNRN